MTVMIMKIFLTSLLKLNYISTMFSSIFRHNLRELSLQRSEDSNDIIIH